MSIKFNDITSQWNEIEAWALPDLLRVLKEGPYINGPNVKRFEEEFAFWCGAKHAIGVSNGTDGLKLALQAVTATEDSVIVMPANGYIADALAPLSLHLNRIKLIDCDEYYNIDPYRLVETLAELKAYHIVLIVVHLYGQAADIKGIRQHYPNMTIIEDCSQAAGAMIDGKYVGTFGDIGVFSLYPTKNLGACGDAGIITSDDTIYYKRICMLKEYGSQYRQGNYELLGWNHRLDEIQAVILRHKLQMMTTWIQRKQKRAEFYNQELKHVPEVTIPLKAPYNQNHTYHLYPIRTRRRNELKAYLEQHGIQTLIHYPRSLNKISLLSQYSGIYPNADRYADELLSLPMHPYLTEEEQAYIVTQIKGFFNDGTGHTAT